MAEKNIDEKDQSSFDNSKAEFSGYDHNNGIGNDVGDFKINRQQKVMVLALGIFGLGVLTLTFFQFKSIINVPWPKEWTQTSAEAQDTIKISDELSADLKNKDTDSDGISDYDELSFYSTSPYLADTDSDGIDDKQEILKNTNPNCPQGQVCDNAAAVNQEPSAPTATVDQSTGQTALPSADQLRRLLTDSGNFTTEQIAGFSDQELMDLYQQIAAQNPAAESTETLNIADLKNYTPDQIRQLLRDQGFTDEELAQFDDQTLLELYKQALDEASGS